jgi:cobalt/nickel transport system permease protein
LDARIKIIGAFLAILGIVVSSLPVAASALLACALLGLTARVPLDLLLKRLDYPLFIASVVSFLHLFTYGSDVVLSLFFIPVYREGISMAMLIFVRILAAVFVLNLLILVTPIGAVLSSLRRLGMPKVVLVLATLMLRYASIFSEEGSRIYRAQWSRLGYSGGYPKKMESYGTLGGMLLIRSLDRAVWVYKAMRSRGYEDGRD